jgi:hypothetical protein
VLKKVIGIAAGLALLAVLACSTGPSTVVPTKADKNADGQPAYFEDVTTGSGLDFTFRNGEEANQYTILESLGGGVGLIDYDGDGLLDIFLTGGGYFDGTTIIPLPCKLYRNMGNFQFRDVTAEVGLTQPAFYNQGIAVADYDNDGWPDLLVTGYGGMALYHNEADGKGGRRFVNVTEQAGLADKRWAASAAWGDLNGDGHLDLYVTHYCDWSWSNNPVCPGYVAGHPRAACSPRSFKPLSHTLYYNNGNGTFRDASKEAGLRLDGKGLGVLIADLDGDGKPDIYVANDTTGNFLYRNLGGGHFEEVGLARSVAYDGRGVAQGSMGVDAADCDGSGRFSIFVTNFQGEAHALYRNLGKGQFQYVSEAAGIAAIGTVFVGFGGGFIDFDRDGNEDLFFVNGHITPYPAPPSEHKQQPFLMRNIGQTSGAVRFQDVSAHGGPFFQVKRVGRGVAFGDLNNSGRTDIVISHINEPAVVLRNVAANDHHWLGIDLVGKPNRDAIGAWLSLEVGGRKLVRQVKGGGSYLSSGDRRVLFGLGDVTEVATLTVRWPSGKTQSWDHLAVDRYWQLTEGESVPKEQPRR